jgi:hypothetical protein
MSITYTLNGQTYSATGNSIIPAGATNVVNNGGGGYTSPAYTPPPAPITPISYNQPAQNNTSPQQNIFATGYTVQAGDKFNPFTGKPLTAAEMAGSVIKPPTTYTPPAPTQGIDVTALNKAPSFQLPTSTANSFTNDANSFVNSLMFNNTQTPAEQELSNNKTNLKSLYDKLAGRSAEAQNLANQYQIPQYTRQLQETNTQLAQKKNEFAAMTQTAENKAIPTSFIVGEQNQIGKTAAVELGALAATAQALQGNIDLAYQTIDRTLEMEYKPIEDQIKYNLTAIDLNYKDMSIEDQKRADRLKLVLDERQQVVDNEKEVRKNNFGLGIEAATNGAPSSVVARASRETTQEGALAILAPYLQKNSNQLIDLGDGKALVNTRDGKVVARYGNMVSGGGGVGSGSGTGVSVGSTTVDPKYQAALDVILGSKSFTKEQKASFVNSIAAGQDPFTVIKNQAKNIMGQTEATTVTKYEAARDAVVELQNALNKYYAAGGKTNVFKGNFEKATNRIGEVSDPALVDIATQIQSQLMVYRNAVSGTAYSVPEGREIASVFPGINKSEGLNKAIVNGRIKSFETSIDATYRTALGQTYDTLKQATSKSLITITDPKTGKSKTGYATQAEVNEAKQRGYQVK